MLTYLFNGGCLLVFVNVVIAVLVVFAVAVVVRLFDLWSLFVCHCLFAVVVPVYFACLLLLLLLLFVCLLLLLFLLKLLVKYMCGHDGGRRKD